MERIIIDTDLSVDDAVGIVTALQSEALKVEGLTVVSSTGGVEESVVRASQLLHACNREDVRIYKGSNHPLQREISKVAKFKEKNINKFGVLERGVGAVGDEAAVDYLIRMVTENPGEITVITMGPLTNIAIAVRKDENFVSKLKKLIVCGGSQKQGNCTPVAEFNFWGDPHAARRVFSSKIQDLRMIGLDITSQVELDAQDLERLKEAQTEQSEVLYQLLKEEVEDETYTINRGVINGSIGIAYLIDEQLIEIADAHVTIETKGISVGQSIVDIGGIWNESVHNCRVASAIDINLFKQIIRK